MSASMRRAHVRYAQYEDTKYVQEHTKPGKRVVQEPAGEKKLMKLVHDDGPEERASKRAHWYFAYNIRKTLIAHPIVEARPGLSNLQRNAQEQADAKIAELEWFQLAATSQLKAQHDGEIAQLIGHCQAAVNQRDERIRQIREDAAQTKQDLEAAYSQQQTVLQAEISKERKEKNIVTEEKNKATDYAKALLEEGTALQHQFDQQTFELNELRRSNENLTASNQALSNDLRQARAYCESVLARHEAEDDSMVQEQIAITFLYDEACQNQDMQLDASMTGVKTAEPIAVKCGRITEVLRDLRSSNVRLQQEKAAVEQEKADIEQLKANIQRERDEELKTYDETYVLVDQLMKSSKEADGVIEQLKAELKAWKNQAARQKPGSGSESHTMDKSMSGGWKEHGTAPVSVAPMTPAGLKSVETPCDEPASATGEDSFEQAGYRGAGGLLTPESMTTDAGEQPSAYVGTPAAKATKPQAQKGRNLMRDIGKPQHRSSKTTNGLSVVKTSGVTKSTNRVRPSILASKVSSDERDAFAAKLEREAKEKASTKDELDQRQQWLADHGRVFLKKQQDHAIRQRILNDEQHGLAEMQSEYNGHFNRAQDLGRLHHPEKEMMEIFGSTFRGGSEDLGAAKKLKD